MRTNKFDELPYILNERWAGRRADSIKAHPIKFPSLTCCFRSFKLSLRTVSLAFSLPSRISSIWDWHTIHVTDGMQYASTFQRNEIWMDFMLATFSWSFNARFANFRSISQLNVIVKVLFYCAHSHQNTILILLHSFGCRLMCANAFPLTWAEVYNAFRWNTMTEFMRKKALDVLLNWCFRKLQNF